MEEAPRDGLILKKRERPAVVGETPLSCQSDEFLSKWAALLGAPIRCHDTPLVKKRCGEIAKHGLKMGIGAVQLPSADAVSH
jgi:hypothetical protein